MDGNRLSTTRSSSSLIIIHSGSPLFSLFFKGIVMSLKWEKMNGEHVVFAYSTRVASGSSQEKKKALKRESHLDCIQHQMRNVSNTLFRCLQRWKEEFFKIRQTCDRVEEHEVLKIRDLPALPLLSHVGWTHQLPRWHHRSSPNGWIGYEYDEWIEH